MRLGIIGGGVVGQAMAKAFVEHVEVRVYDLDKTRRTHDLTSTVAEADIIFICLPTPQKLPSLECDISCITDFFYQAGEWRDHNFVIKSTVPIGTTRLLREKYSLPNLVHSPEFLTARCAFTDAQIPTRNIIGEYTNKVLTHCGMVLEKLYLKRWPHVPIHYMTSDESEMVKLTLNSFFATKVGFFNEAYALATKLGLNWEKVIKGILSDGRISPNHTTVPGPDGNMGFGGTCLPRSAKARLENGEIVNLQTIKERIESGEEIKILSTDKDCVELEYKTVTQVTARDYSGEMINIQTECGIFTCTPDHIMPIFRDGALLLVLAKDILITDGLYHEDS